MALHIQLYTNWVHVENDSARFHVHKLSHNEERFKHSPNSMYITKSILRIVNHKYSQF